MSTSVSPAKARILEKHDDDVVIVSAVRTAITKVRAPPPRSFKF
jgi:acetyl-CoA acyltransferase 1